MIFITGDKHSYYSSIEEFCERFETTKEDILIILGDAGINYYLNEKDDETKDKLSKMPITFFCIHGNHEERPENIKTYKTKDFLGSKVYYEKMYPNILFGIDGEIYNFNNKKVLVIGGAYSIDKYYRIMRGYNWYSSEQPSEETKAKVLTKLKENNYKIDIILSHTCPLKYEPKEAFLKQIDQESIDKTTEKFLNQVEELTTYKKWYCGHFHIDKIIDKIRFMSDDIIELK